MVKNLPAYAGDGDMSSIPESGRSPREGYGNPLQYSCLENPMDRETWQAIYSPQGRTESDMTEQLTFVGQSSLGTRKADTGSRSEIIICNPDHLTCLLRNLYAGQEATVRTGHEQQTGSK